jgi:membrane protein DedA with SNARE-associated domain
MTTLLQQFFYPAIFLLLIACGLGIPLPEDLTLITAGVLAAQGYGRLDIAIVIAIFGVVGGDTILFEIGRRYGKGVERWPLLGHVLTESRIERARYAYRHYGGWMIFASRFLSGLRAALHLAAGMLGVPLWKFVLYDGLASLVSVPVFVWLGFYFSEDISKVIRFEHRSQWVILGLVGVIAGTWLGYHFWRKQHPKPLPPLDPIEAEEKIAALTGRDGNNSAT